MMGNESQKINKDDKYYKVKFKKLEKTKKGIRIIVEKSGAHDLLQNIEGQEDDLDAGKDTQFHQQMARSFYGFDTFRAHIGKLNRLIRVNLPFITMTFPT